MAKTFGVVAVFAAAICLSSLLGVAYCHDDLFVQGKIFCDTCRVGFETPASYPLPGSKVRLSCRNRTTNAVTFSSETDTDFFGNYRFAVEGDHEDELCELALLKSGDPKCSIFLKDHIVDNDRVALTQNNGVAQPIRYANPLFFATKDSLSSCPDILRQMGILPPGVDF